jgi:thiosulfate sulfurtransferase
MFKQLTHKELEGLISNQDVAIADVRNSDSFDEEHIASAIHLSMAALQEFCEKADKTKPIVVYCYHGISSQSVAQHLVDHGFPEVYSLIGGFEGWKDHHSASDASKS